MEVWDIYDRNRIVTGRTMLRGGTFNDGEYHLVVHACVFNKKGEMLIQQRQPFKSGWSNRWDVTVGGSSVAGDTSQTAMERELFEEIGLKVNLQNVNPNLTINYDTGFDDYYLIEMEVDLSTLKLQYEEVQKVKWATLDEIYQLIDSGEFVPYYKSLIQFLFDYRGHMGAINGRWED